MLDARASLNASKNRGGIFRARLLLLAFHPFLGAAVGDSDR